VIFLASAISKLTARRRFIQVVLAYEVLPDRLAHLFAFLTPWVEGTVGLMLALGLITKVVAVLSGLLLISFTVAIGINLARGRTDLECGCFGTRHHPILIQLFILHTCFIVVSRRLIGFVRRMIRLPFALMRMMITTTTCRCASGA
jgi:uncharacterized membrane protein YphA (DoxX/SURF4 family)